MFTGPEAAQNVSIKNLWKKLQEQNRLSFVAVDETHCTEMWGESFRFHYSTMKFLKEYKMPIIALSGSATDRTVNTIITSLNLSEPVIFRTLKVSKKINRKPSPKLLPL